MKTAKNLVMTTPADITADLVSPQLFDDPSLLRNVDPTEALTARGV